MSKDKKPRSYADLTPEQKAKYFGEERNARRRERYHTDPEYRKRVREVNSRSQKNFYAGKRSVKAFSGNDLPEAEYETVFKWGDPKGKWGRRKVFNKLRAAEYLEISPPTLYRWITDGTIPAPIFVDHRGRYYYSAEEMKAIRALYEWHVEKVASVFGAAYTDTIEKISVKIEKIRSKM